MILILIFIFQGAVTPKMNVFVNTSNSISNNGQLKAVLNKPSPSVKTHSQTNYDRNILLSKNRPISSKSKNPNALSYAFVDEEEEEEVCEVDSAMKTKLLSKIYLYINLIFRNNIIS